jgi:hypothetical protein
MAVPHSTVASSEFARVVLFIFCTPVKIIGCDSRSMRRRKRCPAAKGNSYSGVA